MTTTMAEILSKDKQQQEEPQQRSKVFSKLFSRETSAAAPSFRVYYGVASAGSVPFLWESQPGTPKNDAVSAATLPPLTPPPSYYTANAKKQAAARNKPAAGGGSGKKHGGFFSAILPKIILHRRPRSSSSSSPSACSSTSSSSSSAFSSSSSSWPSLSFRSAQSPASASMRSRVFAFSVGEEDSEDEVQAAACFSMRRHESFRAFKSCRVATPTVRSALASSAGGHGTAAPQRV